MDDLISRQAAIDALRKLREEDIEDYGCEIPEGFNQDHLDRATFAIKQLPPIQPDNNSENPNSSDVISRQQAIDDIWTVSPLARLDRKWVDRWLRQLPSALGTNLAEVSTDLISRQALLDKFEPWLKVKDYNDGELNMLKAILYEIRFMRSAEPKRGWWIEIINSRGVVVALRCSRCEKSPRHGVRSDFCPHCGADMRGEQDG